MKHISCPECGETNYEQDPACFACGARLRQKGGGSPARKKAGRFTEPEQEPPAGGNAAARGAAAEFGLQREQGRLRQVVVLPVLLFGLALLFLGGTVWGVYVGSILMILVPVAVVAGMAFMGYTVWRNSRGAARRAPARVLTKSVSTIDYDLPKHATPGAGGAVLRQLDRALGRDPVVTLYTSYDFWVWFELKDGTIEKFVVPEETFKMIEEGQEGELRYRGGKFQEFIPFDDSSR